MGSQRFLPNVDENAYRVINRDAEARYIDVHIYTENGDAGRPLPYSVLHTLVPLPRESGGGSEFHNFQRDSKGYIGNTVGDGSKRLGSFTFTAAGLNYPFETCINNNA